MTKEERNQHAKDISDQYIPNLLRIEVMEDIDRLSIQDLITLYSDAGYAIENGMFEEINLEQLKSGGEKAVKFDIARNKILNIAIEKLKGAPELWTITDKMTNSPFIDDIDQVWIFTEKQLADECLDYYMQQYRTTWEVTEILDAEVFFAKTSYLKGAKAYRIDMGAYAGLNLKREQVAKAPDFTDIPEINRPVINPEFYCAISKFLEEIYYHCDYDGKREKLKIFEDNWIKNFGTSKFLVPFKGLTDDNKQEIEKSGVLSKGATFSIPSLSKTSKDGHVTNYTPVFTDWNEFQMIYKKDEWDGQIWAAKDLLSAPEDNIVINPGSFRFELKKKNIEQALNIYHEESKSNNPKSGGEEAIENAINILNKENTAIPNILSDFIRDSVEITPAQFLEKYGNEEVFYILGYSDKSEKWSMHHTAYEYRGEKLEGMYLTYESALSALMSRSNDCPVTKYVPARTTIKKALKDSWGHRFIDEKGNYVVVTNDSIYRSSRSNEMKRLLEKYTGQTITVSELENNIYTDEIVVWTVSKPNNETSKWSWRQTGVSNIEGLWHDEKCYFVYTSFELANKKQYTGFYPQKVTLHHEISNYKKRPIVLVSDKGKTLIVPQKIFDAMHNMSSVKDNVDVSKKASDIRDYLKIEHSDMSDEKIQKSIDKLKAHNDIFDAFHQYIMTNEYPDTPEIEEYTPKKLHEEVQDKLSPIGIMNYMIYLREDPKNAIEDLRAGLPKE